MHAPSCALRALRNGQIRVLLHSATLLSGKVLTVSVEVCPKSLSRHCEVVFCGAPRTEHISTILALVQARQAVLNVIKGPMGEPRHQRTTLRAKLTSYMPLLSFLAFSPPGQARAATQHRAYHGALAPRKRTGQS